MSEVRSFLITLRSHPSEAYLTDTFLTYLLPFLDSQLRYTYVFEELGTLSEHVHVYVETNFRDKEKYLKNKLLKEVSNKYKNVTHDKQTIFSPEWLDKANQAKLVTKGEEAKTLGYVWKLNGDKKFQGNFSNEEILTAVDVYYKEKLKDKSTIGTNNWKYLTNKQAHASIEKYCEQNEIGINHPWLKQKMQSDKYSFAQLSARYESAMWTELTLANSDKFSYNEKEESKLRSEQHKHNESLPDTESGYQDLYNQNKTMYKFLKANDLMTQYTEFVREYDMLLD